MLNPNIVNEMEDYFEISDDNDIEIIEASLNKTKICSVKLPNGKYVIGIDLEAFKSESELRSALAHELGHIKTDTFYEGDCSRQERRHAEYCAIRWAILYCVPFKAYTEAIADGVRDVWQLSERFGITVKSAIKVVEFYESRYLEYLHLAKEVVV